MNYGMRREEDEKRIVITTNIRFREMLQRVKKKIIKLLKGQRRK